MLLFLTMRCLALIRCCYLHACLFVKRFVYTCKPNENQYTAAYAQHHSYARKCTMLNSTNIYTHTRHGVVVCVSECVDAHLNKWIKMLENGLKALKPKSWNEWNGAEDGEIFGWAGWLVNLQAHRFSIHFENMFSVSISLVTFSLCVSVCELYSTKIYIQAGKRDEHS